MCSCRAILWTPGEPSLRLQRFLWKRHRCTWYFDHTWVTAPASCCSWGRAPEAGTKTTCRASHWTTNPVRLRQRTDRVPARPRRSRRSAEETFQPTARAVWIFDLKLLNISRSGPKRGDEYSMNTVCVETFSTSSTTIATPASEDDMFTCTNTGNGTLSCQRVWRSTISQDWRVQ